MWGVLHLFLRFIISCDVHVVVAFFTFAMCLAFLRCSCFLFLRFRAVQAAQVVQAAKTPMPKTLRPTSGGSPRGYLHVQNVMWLLFCHFLRSRLSPCVLYWLSGAIFKLLGSYVWLYRNNCSFYLYVIIKPTPHNQVSMLNPEHKTVRNTGTRALDI